jgi:magnesium-transporting ATPase (P-type)
MKKRSLSLIEFLLIECLFFFAFFAVLSFINLGSPRLFFIIAIILLINYLLIGVARYIEEMKKEEEASQLLP